MEEIIRQALNLVQENRLEEFQELLLKNIHLFSREVQLEILSCIIEAKIMEKIEILEKLNTLLEKTLTEISANKNY